MPESKNVFTRRDFLKLAGLGAIATGCAPPADKLIPYLVAPDDTLPGVPYWYTSTCTECPVGCGIHVKTREGRAIKIEGNPDHPINQGGLCPRGQAGLQSVYDPDRVRQPLRKEGGSWQPITWDEALQLASDRIGAARGSVTLLTGHATGSFAALAGQWASAAGGEHLAYEPFGHHALREANRRTFNRSEVPNYDFGAAHCLVSFGADFLETWASPAGHARGFAKMRRATESGHFIAIEPRLSMTAVSADEWVAIRPGAEMAMALSMASVILSENLGPGVPGASGLADTVSGYDPDSAAQMTDVPAETIRRLARRFTHDAPSLAVAGGVAAQSEQAVATIAAVNLLNYVAGNVGRTVRFDRTHNYDGLASDADLQRLSGRMGSGDVAVLIVHGANPAHTVPASAGFTDAMDKVPFKISLSSVMDETAERCDLVLPSSHALETLGDAHPARGVHAMIQPTMQKLPMFDARPAGDTLIALAKSAGFGGRMPASWTDYVRAQWRPLHRRLGGGKDFQDFWTEMLQKGGVWEDVTSPSVRWASTPVFAAPTMRGNGELTVVMYPTGALYDGRGANKPWLQELPDPTTQQVWDSWCEIHPDTAKAIGVRNGDRIRVETEAGSVEVSAFLYGGIRKDTIALPMGQGHTAYGRYAKDRGVNPLDLLSAVTDSASGAVAYLSAKASVTKTGVRAVIANAQTEKDQHGRGIAQIIPVSALMGAGHAKGNGHAADGNGHAAEGGASEGEHGGGHHEVHPSQTRLGKHTEPRKLEEGETIPPHAVSAYVPIHPARSGRQKPVSQGDYGNAKHRWAMAIDLNSCTGCSACVVACSAENNIPTVGPGMFDKGRQMQWIRIERFEESLEAGHSDVRFIPMMCQHCSDAPCEIVCPVYATYHNPEGLNAQVYNRCVGTRYCSNNCPYKVRQFNWFEYATPEKPTYAFPEPLNWQLNPDVTVRSKGVMEKCSMCVQRILEGKGYAKDESRDVRDGEIKTACQQSCPTQAIAFGDLTDPESDVSKASHGERGYWVLNELNTKPGVTYLKKYKRDKA